MPIQTEYSVGRLVCRINVPCTLKLMHNKGVCVPGDCCVCILYNLYDYTYVVSAIKCQFKLLEFLFCTKNNRII